MRIFGLNAVFLLSILSASALMSISIITWTRRNAAGESAFYLSVCMAAAAIYNLGYSMELVSTDLPHVMFWVRFQHWGIQALAPAWLLFSIHISGREEVINKRRLVSILIIPVFLLYASQTLGGLNLIHNNPRLDIGEGFSVLTYDRGIFAWISLTFYSFCIATSSFLFYLMRRSTPPSFRRQADIFLFGSLMPWAAMVAYMSGIIPHGLDLTPFALSLSGLIFSIGLFKYRLLDLIPMARDVIFESMNDGVLVVDNMDRIIDFNPSMNKMFPEIERKAIGVSAQEILSSYPEIVEQIQKNETPSFELKVPGDGATQYFECSVSSLIGKGKISDGKIVLIKDYSRIHCLMEKLEKLAALDELTGVFNRRHFEELATREIYRFNRCGGALSMIMLDLDHFKNINDTHGHAAGDAVLKNAASSLATCLRKTDILGRFGGEEFIIILPDTEPEKALMLADKIRARLEELSVPFQDHTFSVTASFGVTGVKSPEKASLFDLFERVDMALYDAKEQGRNAVCTR